MRMFYCRGCGAVFMFKMTEDPIRPVSEDDSEFWMMEDPKHADCRVCHLASAFLPATSDGRPRPYHVIADA